MSRKNNMKHDQKNDMKELYWMTQPNILVQYNLPGTFFTSPKKELDEETCLHEILAILSKGVHFHKDSSDLGDMVGDKSQLKYSLDIVSGMEDCPFLKNEEDSLVRLLCFMKAYASHTYKGGCFRSYFMDVFDVFYTTKP